MTRRLTFCFRRLQESQARAVLCRLSSGTLGRVMRGERSAVHPTDALFCETGYRSFLVIVTKGGGTSYRRAIHKASTTARLPSSCALISFGFCYPRVS
ncbi:hypothetical protein V8C34DRAFT_275573 [Trichoderma compactum]